MDFNLTQPYVLSDFKEWHKGIPYYGFWALEIDDEKLLSQISNAQTQLASILYSGYQRQPHITLLACGLMNEAYFSMTTLAKQSQELKEQNLNCFDLEFSTLNSFSTCPYLALSTQAPILDEIRLRLIQYQSEDSPCNYIPHITLGFYNDTYAKVKVSTELRRAESNLIETKQTVRSIIFARYKTNDLQGPYEIIERIALNNNEGGRPSNI